jgi:serine/threonine protein kinase
VAVLGGDYLESQQFVSVGIILVLSALLLKLKSAIDHSDSEYRKAKDEVAQSQRNITARQGEVASLEGDLVRQREEVARLAELHVEGVFRSASSEKSPLQEAREKLGGTEKDLQTAREELSRVEQENHRMETELGAAMERLQEHAQSGGERAALLAKSAKRSLGVYSPSAGQASRNRIEGSTPGAVSKRRIIATLDDDEDLWLDEDRVVGESRYKVFELTSVYTGAKRAMKVYPADPKTGEFSTPDLIAELCATRDLPRHVNIMAYDKVVETRDEAFVLMELLKDSSRRVGMDLFDYAILQEGISEATARRLFRGYFDALAHLHDTCDVVHNDVKAENLYVMGASRGDTDRDAPPAFEPLTAKIIDFGLALFPGRPPKPAEGNEAFAAPELLLPSFHSQAASKDVMLRIAERPFASKPMDVYRLGCSLYQVGEWVG